MQLAMLAHIPLDPCDTQLSSAQLLTDPLCITSNRRATFTLLPRRQRPAATGKAISVQLVALHQPFLYIQVQRLLYGSLKPNGLEIIPLASVAAEEPDLPGEGAASSIHAVPAAPDLPAALWTRPPRPKRCRGRRVGLIGVSFLSGPPLPVAACPSSAQGRKAQVLHRSVAEEKNPLISQCFWVFPG